MGKVIGTVGVIVGAVALAATGIGAIAAPGLAGAISIGGIKASTLLLAGTALQTAGRALTKQPKASTSTTDRLNASMVTDTPRKMAFGRTALNTDLRYQEWWGREQEYCSQVFAVASHHCEAIEEVWLDDKLAWTAAGGVQGEFVGYLVVAHHAQAGPGSVYRMGWSNRWGASATFSGCATLYLQFKVTGNGKKGKSPFTTTITSRVTVVGKGARVPDPRFDSTAGGSGALRVADQTTWAWAPQGHEAGRNPALALLFYLIGWRIQNPGTGEWKLAVGRGVPVDRIDLGSFITAANLCDEPVMRANGETEPRYRCDGTFSESDDPAQVIAAFETCMNAKLRDSSGRFALQVLHNDLATPVVDFTDDDVLGDFTWTAGNDLNDRRNIVRGRYTNPSALYQLADFPQVRLAPVDGIDRIDSVDFALVQSGSQGQRLAKQRLQRQQYQGAFGAEFNARGWAVKDGDIVRLTFSALGFDKKLFRVSEGMIDPSGVVPLVLVEEHRSIYAWDREEAPAVQAAVPNTFDPLLLPIIVAIDEAGTTAEWPAITGEGKPDDHATNSADPDSPFGPDGTVKEAIATLKRIEPIETEVSALKEVQVEHDDALALLDSVQVDMAAIQRQAERDAGKLDEAMLRLLAESARTREVLRDAGIVVDPATGVVRIYAIDQVAERTSRVEVGLDSVRGTVALKASSEWVSEQIALAVLNPEQAAQLEPIIKRLANAELIVDGLTGAITSKAEAVDVTDLGGRVTTVSETLDTLTGTIKEKVDRTTFDSLGETVQSIEQTLSTLGDTTGMSLTIRQARLIADDAATAALRGAIAGDEASRRQIVQAAEARQDIYTRIREGELTEARARLALAVEVGDVRAMTVSETAARIDAVGAVVSAIETLGVTSAEQAVAIGEISKAALTAQGGVASTQMTIRQVVGRADTSDEVLLRALIAGDEASRARQAQVVQIQTEFATTLVANEQASAVARQSLLARMGAAEAAIVENSRVLADTARSIVERLTAAEAVVNDKETGLAATRARLVDEEKLSAERSAAIAESLKTLDATITDEKTGLSAAHAGIAEAAKAAADANKATADSVTQVTARLDKAGGKGVTVEQAIEATDSRLEKVEGRYTITIDSNGNLVGFQLIGGEEGPGSFNLINTDLRMGTGRIVFNNGTFMEVQGVAFGAAKDLIQWYGPTMAIDQCSRANAVIYKSTDGDAYFGGSLSAGTLRNSAASSSLVANAVAEVPLFGSNGRPVQYVASWSYRREWTRTYSPDSDGKRAFDQDVAAFTASGDGFTYYGTKAVEQQRSTVTLSRSFDGAAFTLIDQRAFTTEQLTFSGLAPTPGDAPGTGVFTSTIGGGFTVLDPVQSTANRMLRLTLARGFANAVDGTTQRLTIVATEE